MQTVSEASLTSVSGQTAWNSSSLVTSRPAFWSRCDRTAKTFGVRRMDCDPRQRQAFAVSRQNGPKRTWPALVIDVDSLSALLAADCPQDGLGRPGPQAARQAPRARRLTRL